MSQWVHMGGAHCTMTMVPYYTSPSQFDNGIKQIKPQIGIMQSSMFMLQYVQFVYCLALD